MNIHNDFSHNSSQESWIDQLSNKVNEPLSVIIINKNQNKKLKTLFVSVNIEFNELA